MRTETGQFNSSDFLDFLSKNVVSQGEGEIFLRDAKQGDVIRIGQDFFRVLGEGSVGKILTESVKSGGTVEISGSVVVKKE
jgi:hypothetical protein